jgi:hypothetical protein
MVNFIRWRCRLLPAALEVFGRFDNPVIETEPASCCSEIGRLDGGMPEFCRRVVFNLLVKWAAMLKMLP